MPRGKAPTGRPTGRPRNPEVDRLADELQLPIDMAVRFGVDRMRHMLGRPLRKEMRALAKLRRERDRIRHKLDSLDAQIEQSEVALGTFKPAQFAEDDKAIRMMDLASKRRWA